MDYQKEIASQLLEIGAFRFNVDKPFKWTSGWYSPVYCDTRLSLSYHLLRKLIIDNFVQLIKAECPDVELIAGVATGAIAQAGIIADKLELPMVYVRSEAKSHGLGNKIEGTFKKGQKVVVIEDVISTGDSSFKAVESLKQAELKVLGLLSIYSYDFEIAKKTFVNNNIFQKNITNFETLLNLALEKGRVTQNELKIIQEWQKNPSQWLKNT